MFKSSHSLVSLVGLLTCILALAIAYFYFQLWLGLPPCPLCILDRWIILAIGLGFLLLLFDRLRLIALLWNSLFLVAGFLVGGRHLWLENFAVASGSGGCTPQRSQGIVNFLTDAFVGTADCSLVLWQFLGLSIAGWTFVLYIVLAVLLWFSRAKPQNT